MGALIHNSILDTRQSIEDHGSSTTLNIVDGCLDEGGADSKGNSVFVK